MCFRPSSAGFEKKCPKCATPYEGDATVCPKCGAALPVVRAAGAPGAPAAPGAPGAPKALAAPGTSGR